MGDKYTVALSFGSDKWYVFERLTDSIRVHFKACQSKKAAEELADKLNAEENRDEM